MGQFQTQCEFITIEKNHPLNDQLWKTLKLVLPNIMAVFEKSSKAKWVLEGVVLDAKNYCVKEVTMLSIAKFNDKSGIRRRRLEVDFKERQIYLLQFEIDPIQSKFKHQLIKKNNLVAITNIKCKQKKRVINLLEDCITNNHY
jgi:hypothetical protein